MVLICPVPEEQQPLKEFIQFSNSWFFSQPKNSIHKFRTFIIKTWLATLPIIIFIETGSINLKNNILILLFSSMIFSLSVPMIFLIRQWYGWEYIYKRLYIRYIIYLSLS